MISRRSSVVVSLVALVALTASALLFAVRVVPEGSGAVGAGANSGFGAQGFVVAPIPGAATAFEAGDVVTSIAGSELDSWPVAPSVVPTANEGDTARDVSASVIRDGEAMHLLVPLTSYPLADYLVVNAGTLTFLVVLLAGAVFVFSRRPRDPAAAALLIFAVGIAGSTPVYLAGIDPLDFARGSVTAGFFATVVVYFLTWSGGIHFALSFPRPHPRVARHPRLLLLPYGLVYVALAVSAVLAFTSGSPGLLPIASFNDLGNLITLIVLVLIGAFLLGTWRRSDIEERHMLRGLVLTAGLAIAAGVALQFLPELLFGTPILPWSLAGIVGLPFAIALLVAVWRHGAFDIDVVVNRSLVYGGLTAAVLAIYTVTVGLLGVVLSDGTDYAAALLATGVAALAALPIRDVLQRSVDRALYGDRDEPMRAMRRLGERLTWTMDPEAMPDVIVATVADALRLPYVALEIGASDDARVIAQRGSPPTDSGDRLDLPLVARSVPVGRLRLSTREPGQPLSVADTRLLHDLAGQVGPAVDNLALNDALLRSRERIVLAGEEERRRLRRDLHDGLGPALASIGMRAETAERLVEDDPAAARAMLGEVREGVQGAVTDIRRLVDGLRPPALDELGLVGAIEQQADRLGVEAPSFIIHSPEPLGELPAAVEVAAYRIAVEAMTNVVRHSGAGSCEVHVHVDGDGQARRLALEVRDDGRGLDGSGPTGVGLTSMRERAAEVGGSVAIERAPNGGTQVAAQLPLASA